MMKLRLRKVNLPEVIWLVSGEHVPWPRCVWHRNLPLIIVPFIEPGCSFQLENDRSTFRLSGLVPGVRATEVEQTQSLES